MNIPLELWNPESLEAIGGMLGDYVRIIRNTRDKSSITYRVHASMLIKAKGC